MKEKRLMHIEESKSGIERVLPDLPNRARSPISPLAIHPDKFTYTFIFNNEVISIHYDRIKGDIFYQGHNIKNLNLDRNKLVALEKVARVLNEDEEGKTFIEEYKATLHKHLTDNK